MGFSASIGEIPADGSLLTTVDPRNLTIVWRNCVLMAGAALALSCGEYRVLRAALLSIVLTVAAGQSVSLMYTVWCHPHEAATNGCEHQDPTTSPSAIGPDASGVRVSGRS